MIGALPVSWGEGLTIAGTVGVALVLFGLTVAAHEFGHFWAARKMGLVVERFAIGFGPKIYGKVIDGVEWQVNLLPLGGFVQLPQMSPAEGIEGKPGEEHRDLPRRLPGQKSSRPWPVPWPASPWGWPVRLAFGFSGCPPT